MRSSPLHALDALSFNRYHAQATLTTGMGVFTDGYDLASVGIVLPLILSSFGQAHLTGLQASLLTASALGGAARVYCFALGGTFSESLAGQMQGALAQQWPPPCKRAQRRRWPASGSPEGSPPNAP